MSLNQQYTDCPYSDNHAKVIWLVNGIPADAIKELLRSGEEKPLIVPLSPHASVSHTVIQLGQSLNWLKANYSEGAD